MVTTFVGSRTSGLSSGNSEISCDASEEDEINVVAMSASTSDNVNFLMLRTYGESELTVSCDEVRYERLSSRYLCSLS